MRSAERKALCIRSGEEIGIVKRRGGLDIGVVDQGEKPQALWAYRRSGRSGGDQTLGQGAAVGAQTEVDSSDVACRCGGGLPTMLAVVGEEALVAVGIRWEVCCRELGWRAQWDRCRCAIGVDERKTMMVGDAVSAGELGSKELGAVQREGDGSVRDHREETEGGGRKENGRE